MNTFPRWLKKTLSFDNAVHETKAIVESARVRTVCESSLCPNTNECYSRRFVAFLILGARCTRNCAFCSAAKGDPLPPDSEEPRRIVDAVIRLHLGHVVITSVTRDDLEDGGAEHFIRVMEELRSYSRDIMIELLVPDFRGNRDAIRRVCAASPDIFGHNIETVHRLYPAVRPGADYRRSLDVLSRAKDYALKAMIKSSLLVGFGEEREEVMECMRDLKDAGCDIIAIGQYLRPSRDQLPVHTFIRPEEFSAYKEAAYKIGFALAITGPFVRSSYEANCIYGNDLRRKEIFGHDKSRAAAVS